MNAPPRIVAALIVASALLAAPRPAAALDAGESFKTLLGETLDGQRIELAVFRNYKILLVEFWATWSPPSVAHHQALRAMAERGEMENVVWISVSLDRDPDVARAFFDANPSPAIRVCDGDGFESEWVASFGVISAPTYYIVDLEGLVRDVSTSLRGDLARRLVEARRPPRPGQFPGMTDSSRLQRPEKAEINRLAPDFSMPSVRTGEGDIRLHDFENKVFMIVLFASWNKKSTQYLLDLISIHEKASPYGFDIIGVSIETDPRDVRRWIDELSQRIRFPVTAQRPDDPASITYSKFEFTGDLPWAFLIGKDGIVRDMGVISEGRVRQVLVEDLNFRL